MWGTQRRRLESISDHIYGSEILAIAIYYQFSYDIDLAKVIMMLAVHELDKIELEDITFFCLPGNSKEASSHRVAEFVLKDFLAKKEIISLLDEYDAKTTKESKFAYQVGILETLIEMKKCDALGCFEYESKNALLEGPKIKALLEKENSISNIQIEFDKNKFGDKNFVKIVEYLKNNDIW